MAAKLALFLALSLLLAVAAQGGAGPVIPSYGKCPRDALKINLCANVLNLVKLGLPDYRPCCPLLGNLVDLDAAACLCTIIKGDVLGIKIKLPVDLSLALNQCGKKCPSDFKC